MQLHWVLRLLGPRAMVFGQIIHCQIHLALENLVETPYKFHC